MRIFVTTGTTKFNSLVKEVISLSKNTSMKITLQYPSKKFNHPRITHFQFTEKIDKYYKSADIVITHAGAGTCYKLLESGIKPIVVPNLERSDSHQRELALYIEKNNYSSVCWKTEKIEEHINKHVNSNFIEYQKDDFIYYDFIFS